MEQVGIHSILSQGIQQSSLLAPGLSAEADGLLRLLLLLGAELGDVEGVHPRPVEVVLGPGFLPRVHLVVSLRAGGPRLVRLGVVVETPPLGGWVRNV